MFRLAWFDFRIDMTGRWYEEPSNFFRFRVPVHQHAAWVFSKSCYLSSPPLARTLGYYRLPCEAAFIRNVNETRLVPSRLWLEIP